MRKLVFAVLITATVGLAIGSCFGAAFYHWACSAGWQKCPGPRVRSSDLESTLGAEKPLAAASGQPAPTVTEEHLLKRQDSVLHDIETSNAETKEMLNFGLLSVGFMGTILLGVVGFFGFSTAGDLRAQKKRADVLIKRLEKAEKQVESTQAEITRKVWEQLRLKLSNVTDYGLKIAEFAGSQWESMSYEDRLRNCDEAAMALKAADLGDGGNRALSFVMAQTGVAYLEADEVERAVEALIDACAHNVGKIPDRPFNLACAYSKLSKSPRSSQRTCVAKAIAQLKLCLSMARDEAEGSSISKEFFRKKIDGLDPEKLDHDLDPIRPTPEFVAFVADLHAQK
jgi:hypothetical protein